MTWAIFKVMLLGLLRDKGALLMTFVLPPLIFIIFTGIFSSTSDDQLNLTIAVADQVHSKASRTLVDSIRNDASVRIIQPEPRTESEARDLVHSGKADGAIVLRKGRQVRVQPIEFWVTSNPTREMGLPVLLSKIQSASQALRYQCAVTSSDAKASHLIPSCKPPNSHRGGLGQNGSKIVIEKSTPERKTQAMAVYYAGAVGILFVLFSSIGSALSFFEEKQSGVYERILSKKSRFYVVIQGKFFFILFQGFLQLTSIFLTAALLYQVPMLSNGLTWWITTGLTASSASAVALALVIAARSRSQAQHLSNFSVLILSALGGCMIPRFLMPQWLQQLGWLTPNAWVIESYQLVFSNSLPWQSVLPFWGALFSFTLLGLVTALFLAGRMRYRT